MKQITEDEFYAAFDQFIRESSKALLDFHQATGLSMQFEIIDQATFGLTIYPEAVEMLRRRGITLPPDKLDKVTAKTIKLWYAIQDVCNEYRAEHGRFPTDDELVDLLLEKGYKRRDGGYSREHINRTRRTMRDLGIFDI